MCDLLLPLSNVGSSPRFNAFKPSSAAHSTRSSHKKSPGVGNRRAPHWRFGVEITSDLELKSPATTASRPVALMSFAKASMNALKSSRGILGEQ
ncbi:hypothetical protein QE152_g38687 [Popillia japonica]|uniref:Uncharacterized protein n=1 Tax=Popillia japonica TaxID=7064 RepID=A0AAW1HWE7_POPJA